MYGTESEKGEEDLRKDFLLALVKRETEIRLSEETQSTIDQYLGNPAKMFELTTSVQQKAVREFGFVGEDEYMGLRLLRAASSYYMNENIIKETFYVKYNRASSGTLQVGDSCPNPVLFSLKGEETNLLSASQMLTRSCASEHKIEDIGKLPVVIVAGSAS
eukprot:TRINITY_DN63976_c0_g1_i1.p1 TRINITY_DN63976_c0_g1~~TRINITY_DN63976_c0_g1_i1.p1  ORF type:complete len:161 (+),score=29.45 TRINITY_DN63976_c0_g1_i1:107-589(+)